MTEQISEETWVTTTEGAAITGYHRVTVSKLLSKMLEQPEETREIRLRKRSNGWEMWLPDLIAYSKNPRYKPYGKRKPPNS